MATYEDLEFDQGADIAIEIECVDVNGNIKDLTNHAVTATMKRTYSSTNADDIQAFNAIVVAPPTAGKITLSLTNALSSTLRKGRWVYDVEIAHADSANYTLRERILEGQINVSPQVTT
tara:strand:+ start:132 stop:488 length:357 start_codon:yes stop_codon:yes gene_type:complete